MGIAEGNEWPAKTKDPPSAVRFNARFCGSVSVRTELRVVSQLVRTPHHGSVSSTE